MIISKLYKLVLRGEVMKKSWTIFVVLVAVLFLGLALVPFLTGQITYNFKKVPTVNPAGGLGEVPGIFNIVKDYPTDPDKNGLYDKIVFDTEIRVNESGEYFLFVRAEEIPEPPEVGNSVNLKVGEVMYLKGKYPLYFALNSSDVAILHFDGPPIYLSEGDYFTRYTEDGEYHLTGQLLGITYNHSVPNDSIIRFSYELRERVWFIDKHYDSFNLSKGKNDFKIKFDWYDVRSEGIEAKLTIKDVSLVKLPNEHVFDGNYIYNSTNFYNYTEFESVPVLDPIFREYGEDINGNGLYENIVIEISNLPSGTYNYLVADLWDLYNGFNYNHFIINDDYYWDEDSEDLGEEFYLNPEENITIRIDGYKYHNNQENLSLYTKFIKFSRDFKDHTFHYKYPNAIYLRQYNFTEFDNRTPLNFNLSDYGKDVDNNSLYDYLVVAIDGLEAGFYVMDMTLEDDSGKTFRSFFPPIIHHQEGETIEAEFNGILFNHEGRYTPYNVKEFAIYNLDTNYLYYYYDTYSTSFYNYSEFDNLGLEVLENFTDYGLDEDGNGLYDYFYIDYLVNVTKPDTYIFSADLNYDWTYFNSGGIYLDEGIHNLKLKFSGFAINREELEGPYFLETIRVSKGNAGVDFDVNYLTEYYNYTEFENDPGIKVLDMNFTDYGLDLDNNSLYDYLIVAVPINVTRPGGFEVHSVLFLDEGNTLYVNDNYYVNYSDNFINLWFSGEDIYSGTENGSYKYNLNIRKDGYPFYIGYNFYTSYYNYTQFEH